MTASLSVTGSSVQAASSVAAKPSFVGLVRGELLKVSRQWTTWIMAVLLAGVICLPFLITLTVSGAKTELQAAPLAAMYQTMGRSMLVLRVFSGTFLIILTARLIGMEYSSGTIRILLSRGVGRLQLLAAKLTTIALVALVILIGGIALDALLTVVTVGGITGNLDALNSLNSGFWDDARLYVGTIAISMVLTILMTTAFTVLGRSLAIGLSVGLSFFAVDNIGVIFFMLAYKLTDSTFWTLATGDLLGPNLNEMARALLPVRAKPAAFRAFAAPLVPVDGGHTLLVATVYAAIFAVVAIGLTWKRDVTQ